MNQKFINDHKVGKVEIFKILRITAGHFHCWCDSNVGAIRKPNNAVSNFLWDNFNGIKPAKIIDEMFEPKALKEKWYQKLWNWILKLLTKVGINKKPQLT